MGQFYGTRKMNSHDHMMTAIMHRAANYFEFFREISSHRIIIIGHT